MIAGQYLAFIAIVAVSIAIAALGSTLLPPAALPYFGLIPILLGLKAGWSAYRERRSDPDPAPQIPAVPRQGPRMWQVAAVTFANGGDNIGVYVPIFAVAATATISMFTAVFLIGVAIWCAGGKYVASHPLIANVLSRWGHIVLPVALISIGVTILITGGAFGP
ncbi:MULTISPECIES: cadmium resistance transporter [unclassified Mycobacterium]|uniref:cadmium resistance transporter n=1 Tax=unclassified Mycobacterium TaxID=2642494 RepID=UPI00257029AF|nr:MULTISPECIES: cadmium resistance transporter [unclassified Mycobacterium]